MNTVFRRLAGALAICACLAASVHAEPGAKRELTVDDIVGLEGFGRASIAPGGRWAVYERRGAYDTLRAVDYVQRSVWTITDLWRIDLTAVSPRPERLLPDEGLGLLRGEWSPDGARMAVFRLQGGRYELGIAEVGARQVRWTGLTPDFLPKGAPVVWASPNRLLVVTRPDGSLPPLLAAASNAQARVAAAWRVTSEGRVPSRTVIDTDAGVQTPETATPVQHLVELDAVTGAVIRVLFAGVVTDQVLSPDGRMLAVLLGAERLKLADPPLSFDDPFRQRLLMVRMADGRRTAPSDRLDVATQMLRWSPDSREVLFWARRDDQRWSEGGLRSMAQDGTLRRWPTTLDLGGDINILRGVRADWLQGAPVIYGRPSPDARADWFRLDGAGQTVLTAGLTRPPASLAAAPESGALRLFAEGGYWRMDAKGVQRLTSPGLTVQPMPAYDPERPRRIVLDAPRQDWTAAVQGAGQAVVVTDDNIRTIGPATDAGETQILAASADALLVLVRDELVERLRLRRGRDDILLDQVNADLADVRLIDPEFIAHANALGEADRSALFLPPGPARGVVVSVYPGFVDEGRWAGPLILTYNIRAQVLAAAGYAVINPAMPIDRPGTRSFAHYRDSVDRAVDAVFAAHPELPRDRTAVFGHSMGGYAGLAIATQTTRYQSYILSSPPADMFAMWGEFNASSRSTPEYGVPFGHQQGWVENGQGELGATPWTDPVAYVRESPWLRADRISAPVLLLTADMDYVGLTNAERVFSALSRLGGRSRIVTYWGEHHARWSPANIRDQYDQIFRWLEETLPPSGTVTATARKRDGAPMPLSNPRTPPP